ncbi:hypothetical protein LHA35_28170, partial [Roseicella sp. GB24]|nr:hypothetical protein [Roseicella aerolata]
MAGAYLRSHEEGWRNPKHRGQWRSTLERYVFPAIGATPVALASVRPGVVGDQALREAVSMLEAIALQGAVREPAVRVCRDEQDDGVWLDLGREDWGLVHVNAQGWRLVPGANVPLLRPRGLRPLPVPVRVDRDLALADLRRLLNLRPGEAGQPSGDIVLAVLWLVSVLYPRGPYPVLALDGEQGSAKTTMSLVMRRLADPNLADIQPMPKQERDLALACRNGRLLALDNLSSIAPDMADALCRVATGSGFRERQLYTNDEENMGWVQNPVLLNGIPALLARGDLADRAIALTLPAIPDHLRRTEVDFWREFDTAAAGILGLLLDAIATALRRLPEVRLERPPRMADFAWLACAAAPAFGWSEGQVLAALEENRAAAVAGVIEADAVAATILALAQEHGAWIGTPSELNRTGMAGGFCAWVMPPGRLSPVGHSSAPRPRREGCFRSA